MNEDCLKLTTYFGERDRAEGGFLADALLDLYGRHELAASVLLRGIEGFGMKHRLHTQRLLTLSEDLPLVSIAVDTRERIQRALPEVIELSQEGLVTLERARLLTRPMGTVDLPEDLHEATKLTVYCGRKEKVANRPAVLFVVDVLRSHGVAGATALLGVDGTAHGMRRRARFFGANAGVPVVVIAVGAGEEIAATLPELTSSLERPLMTLERVRLCKRDGERLAQPTHLPEHDDSGLNIWQKLMVYAGEQARHGGQSLYTLLIQRLREEGASGATALRGVWGYHGDHEPHGERLLSLRRHVPVLTTIVDRPERIRRWFRIVDELTDETGLVTSETVPAYRAQGPAGAHGGLQLARGGGGEER